MLGTVIKGWRRYLFVFVFSCQEKSIPGGYDSKILSICVPHFTTNLLGLMHLKPVKCFTSRKYITHAEPMRESKALCCYSQQNGVSHTPTASPLSLFLWVTSFSRFSPWCCSSMWPWRAQEIALQALGAEDTSHSKPLAIPSSAEITESDSFPLEWGSRLRGKEEGRRNHIAVHKLRARQWTRLIHTFSP